MANSVDPGQTAPIGAVCSASTLFAIILDSSVMLGNYLQQTTSADDIFRCIFFGALRVNQQKQKNSAQLSGHLLDKTTPDIRQFHQHIEQKETSKIDKVTSTLFRGTITPQYNCLIIYWIKQHLT